MIPEDLDLSRAAPGVFRKGPRGLMGSLSVVLRQEVRKLNILLGVVRSSLQWLKQGIQGFVVMSSELEAMHTSLKDHQVPRMWADVAYPSLKPLASWVKDLAQRVAFFRAWLTRGQPRLFHLSSFFFPQGFLTAVLQRHARCYKLPINTLEFTFHFKFVPARTLARMVEDDAADRRDTSKLHDGDNDDDGEAESVESGLDTALDPDAVGSDGVVVEGIWFDGGAAWNDVEGYMTEATPGQMYAPMPAVHFLPKVAGELAPEEAPPAPGAQDQGTHSGRKKQREPRHHRGQLEGGSSLAPLPPAAPAPDQPPRLSRRVSARVARVRSSTAAERPGRLTAIRRLSLNRASSTGDTPTMGTSSEELPPAAERDGEEETEEEREGMYLYECPVYKTATRAGALSTTGISTNFVASIRVPTPFPPRHWIWRGAGMLLSLPE